MQVTIQAEAITETEQTGTPGLRNQRVHRAHY